MIWVILLEGRLVDSLVDSLVDQAHISADKAPSFFMEQVSVAIYI